MIKFINDRLVLKKMLKPDFEEFKNAICSEREHYDLDDDFQAENIAFIDCYKVLSKTNEIIAYFGLSQYEEDSICFCYFYIYPKFRKQGYGSEILKIVVDNLKQEKIISYVYGIISAKNEVALQFYIRNGYKFLSKNRIDAIEFNEKECFISTNDDGTFPCYEVILKLEEKNE